MSTREGLVNLHADWRVAYIQEEGHDKLKETNTKLLENAIVAIEAVSPALKTVILQTGGKA